jgi:hypothetical protein
MFSTRGQRSGYYKSLYTSVHVWVNEKDEATGNGEEYERDPSTTILPMKHTNFSTLIRVEERYLLLLLWMEKV